MTENKPCPFCGGTQLSADWDLHRWMHITCNACGARSGDVRVQTSSNGDTIIDDWLENAEARAFAEWNGRVQ